MRKITPEIISKIKHLHNLGHSQREIGRACGISQFTVFRAIHGVQKKPKPKSDLFIVDGRCWLTGITYDRWDKHTQY